MNTTSPVAAAIATGTTVTATGATATGRRPLPPLPPGAQRHTQPIPEVDERDRLRSGAIPRPVRPRQQKEEEGGGAPLSQIRPVTQMHIFEQNKPSVAMLRNANISNSNGGNLENGIGNGDENENEGFGLSDARESLFVHDMVSGLMMGDDIAYIEMLYAQQESLLQQSRSHVADAITADSEPDVSADIVPAASQVAVPTAPPVETPSSAPVELPPSSVSTPQPTSAVISCRPQPSQELATVENVPAVCICADCDVEIKSDASGSNSAVFALGKFWHRHHIRCSVCSKPIPQKPDRYERDEKVYCRADYLRLFAPKCVGCNRAVEIQDGALQINATSNSGPASSNASCLSRVMQLHPYEAVSASAATNGSHGIRSVRSMASNMRIGGPPAAVNEVINAFGGIWHVYCFTCQMCRCRFDDTRGQFYVFENRPFCRYHFHLRNGSICKHCSLPIEGQGISINSKSGANNNNNNDDDDDDDDEDYGRNTSKNTNSNDTGSGSNSRVYHLECFMCVTCKTSIHNQKYHLIADKIYCEDHGKAVYALLNQQQQQQQQRHHQYHQYNHHHHQMTSSPSRPISTASSSSGSSTDSRSVSSSGGRNLAYYRRNYNRAHHTKANTPKIAKIVTF